MSFLLDPPSLIILGVLLSIFGERYHWKNRSLKIVGGVIIAAFWIGSVALYLDVISYAGLVTTLDYTASGSIFMFHTSLTGLKKSGVPKVLVVLMFLLYPVWLYIGFLVEKKIFNRVG